MRLRSLCAAVLFLVNVPLAALAQAPPSATGRIVYAGEDAFSIVQRWEGRRGSLRVRGPNGVQSTPLTEPAFITAAARADAVLIALTSGSSVRVIFVPIAEGRPGTPRDHAVARPGGRQLTPVGASIAVRPDGFELVWQEAPTVDPNAAWSTFDARFDARGRQVGASRAFPQVPWPIADAGVLGGQLFLVLYFSGGMPNDTRLCAVRISDAGDALEHPWWASRPGNIGEVQLAIVGARAIAVYRDGSELLEADVTAGGWGQESPEPRRHGALGEGEIFGVRGSADAVVVGREQGL
jgi:hypothetical protein